LLLASWPSLKFENQGPTSLLKMRPHLLLADLATAKMGRLDQKEKISKISTLI
jgi:hypothetical protein